MPVSWPARCRVVVAVSGGLNGIPAASRIAAVPVRAVLPWRRPAGPVARCLTGWPGTVPLCWHRASLPTVARALIPSKCFAVPAATRFVAVRRNPPRRPVTLSRAGPSPRPVPSWRTVASPPIIVVPGGSTAGAIVTIGRVIPGCPARSVAARRSGAVLGVESVPGSQPVFTGPTVPAGRAIVIRHRIVIRRWTILARRTIPIRTGTAGLAMHRPRIGVTVAVSICIGRAVAIAGPQPLTPGQIIAITETVLHVAVLGPIALRRRKLAFPRTASVTSGLGVTSRLCVTAGRPVTSGRPVTTGRPMFPWRSKPAMNPVAVGPDIRTGSRGRAVTARARAAVERRVTGSRRVLPVAWRPTPRPVPIRGHGRAAIGVRWLAAGVLQTRHIAEAASCYRLIAPRPAARIVAATRPWADCPRLLHRLACWLLPYLFMRLMPDLPVRLALVPDLAGRFGPVRLRLDGPPLDRHRLNRLRLDRLRLDGPALDRPAVRRWTIQRLASGRIGPVLARRDDRCNRSSDPERVKPLIGFDVTGLDRDFAPRLARIGVLPVACRAVLARLTLSRLAPAPAPPGHG
jgi:hypothetical protein